MGTLLIWVGYGLMLLFLARLGRGNDAVLPGKVNVFVQALAYVATYISAVALVGFGGLCHQMGLQMLLVAAGNMWLGTWFVYRYLAWPTKRRQEEFGARTPAHLIAKAYQAPRLRPVLGVVTAILLVIYSSAVFKGAALMLAEALPLEGLALMLTQVLPLAMTQTTVALVILVAVVAVAVLLGGLRGVLYTEAFQGAVMVFGVLLLVFGTIKAVGGLSTGLESLAQVPPTPKADQGFLALSSGSASLNVIFLALVTSVGIWAQPQLIQRHFALKDQNAAYRAAPLAVLVIGLIVGGAYFAAALSRVIMPGDMNPDQVIPTLVTLLLPSFGQQLFVIAIVSASLSTASALLHIAASGLGEDFRGRKLSGPAWVTVVIACALGSGICALVSSQIIAAICTISWTLIASAFMVPYLALLIKGRQSPWRGWLSSLGGLACALLWYVVGYGDTSLKLTGLTAPGLWGAMHPMVIGLAASLAAFGLAVMLEKKPLVIASALSE